MNMWVYYWDALLSFLFYFLYFFSYGRKIIFILSTIFMAITGIGQAISTNYTTFTLFAYLNAVGTSGVFPLAFIIGIYFDFVFFLFSFSTFSLSFYRAFVFCIKINLFSSIW